MKSTLSLALLLALLLAAPAGFAQETPVPAPADDEAQDLVATLEARGDFTILVDALRDTGLDAALTTDETFTLFAPTDEAFQKLPAGTLEGLTPEQLTDLLRYHVLAGAVASHDAAALSTAPSVQGHDLTISATDGRLAINDATVTEADVQASNGVIHVIDSVLMPQADGAMEEASMEVEGASMEIEEDASTEKDVEMKDAEDEGEMTPDPQR